MCYNAGAFCKAQKANDILKLLIKADVDVNEDVSKYKALNYVIERGFVETIYLLVDAGANVNAFDKDGWAPLHKLTSSRRFFVTS